MAVGSAAPPFRVEPIDRDPNPGLRSALLHGFYDAMWLLVGLIGSPLWVWRAIRIPDFRTMLAERTGWRRTELPELQPGRRRVLIHAVSVGEVKGAQSMVRRLQAERPDLEPVISTTTSTGLKVGQSLFPELTVLRFPADASPIIGRFVRRVDPVAVLLIELEVWPNFLRAANRGGIPIVVVNGRITESSFGQYKVFRGFFPQFNRITLFCVQNETYSERFTQLSVEPGRILITGNVKVDGLGLASVEPSAELRGRVRGHPGQIVFVAGSTHDPEEEMILEAWRSGAPEVRLVLVPRHPKRAPELVRRLGELGARPQLLTELRAGVETLDRDRPLLVDTVGELEQVFGAGDIAFIGGSLIPRGGQNVLEPAAQGLPVLTGTSNHNFVQETQMLAEAGASSTVEGPEHLARELRRLVDDPDLGRRMGELGQAAIAKQRGATDSTWSALAPIMGSAAPPPTAD